MRKLTILRNKSFVGCAAKLKVYIQDAQGQTEINGVKCKLLGKIANGEKLTFEIANGKLKVFVIADALSKNYCNDFYVLEDNENDVTLSGGCKFNPMIGNAFRFDNNTNKEALENRKNAGKSGILILAISVIIGLVLGYMLVRYFL